MMLQENDEGTHRGEDVDAVSVASDKDCKRSVLQFLQRSLITMLDLVCLICTRSTEEV